jgi:hypothetical protein
MSLHPTEVPNHDRARDSLRHVQRRFPFIDRIFANASYQGPKMAKVVAAKRFWHLEIVKRADLLRFVDLPKRGIVERTFA